MNEKQEQKADAVLALAMGQSKAAAARHAEVSTSTLGRWLAEPAFVEEVERLRPLATARPVDGGALVAAVEECRGRLRGFAVNGPSSVTTYIRIPADATPAQARRIKQRAYARALAAVMAEQT